MGVVTWSAGSAKGYIVGAVACLEQDGDGTLPLRSVKRARRKHAARSRAKRFACMPKERGAVALTKKPLDQGVSQPMAIGLSTAQFVVEGNDGSGEYRLVWPRESYYGLVRSPVQVLQIEASELTRLARLDASDFPDVRRLQFHVSWFMEAVSGSRTDWPALPVLVRQGDELEFIDGRHRCEALELLGALRVPVIVG